MIKSRYFLFLMAVVMTTSFFSIEAVAKKAPKKTVKKSAQQAVQAVDQTVSKKLATKSPKKVLKRATQELNRVVPAKSVAKKPTKKHAKKTTTAASAAAQSSTAPSAPAAPSAPSSAGSDTPVVFGWSGAPTGSSSSPSSSGASAPAVSSTISDVRLISVYTSAPAVTSTESGSGIASTTGTTGVYDIVTMGAPPATTLAGSGSGIIGTTMTDTMAVVPETTSTPVVDEAAAALAAAQAAAQEAWSALSQVDKDAITASGKEADYKSGVLIASYGVSTLEAQRTKILSDAQTAAAQAAATALLADIATAAGKTVFTEKISALTALLPRPLGTVQTGIIQTNMVNALGTLTTTAQLSGYTSEQLTSVKELFTAAKTCTILKDAHLSIGAALEAQMTAVQNQIAANAAWTVLSQADKDAITASGKEADYKSGVLIALYGVSTLEAQRAKILNDAQAAATAAAAALAAAQAAATTLLADIATAAGKTVFVEKISALTALLTRPLGTVQTDTIQTNMVAALGTLTTAAQLTGYTADQLTSVKNLLTAAQATTCTILDAAHKNQLGASVTAVQNQIAANAAAAAATGMTSAQLTLWNTLSGAEQQALIANTAQKTNFFAQTTVSGRNTILFSVLPPADQANLNNPAAIDPTTNTTYKSRYIGATAWQSRQTYVTFAKEVVDAANAAANAIAVQTASTAAAEAQAAYEQMMRNEGESASDLEGLLMGNPSITGAVGKTLMDDYLSTVLIPAYGKATLAEQRAAVYDYAWTLYY